MPALMAQPISDFSYDCPLSEVHIPDMRTASYDDIVELLAYVESDAFQEEDTLDSLDQINQLVSFLAIEGASSDEQLPIQMSIASLFRQDDIQYAFYDNSAKYGVVPCKSWYKK